MSEKIFGKEKSNRAALVSVVEKGGDDSRWEVSLAELERLTDTAGGEVIFKMVQEKESPDPRTYIGSGKLTELHDMCKKNDIDTVIFDDELSPSQIKNIQDELEKDGEDVNVIDRSMLILDIFALHAVTGEGKLQVELAQLRYTVPRLTGHGTELSRLGGGIGTRGPGESKLESDRRHVNRRIFALEKQLSELEKNREVQRVQRDKSGIYKIAIAGYTNAGKSTLLNFLTGAGILAQDKLFATLDPTTRKYVFESGEEVLLTDTVGFIRNLPHHLIEAFKSTLSELKYADAIAVVTDVSDPEAGTQLAVTESLISQLGAGDKPILYIYNKCDRGVAVIPLTPTEKSVYISAVTGEGTDELKDKLEKLVRSGKKVYIFEIPVAKSSLLDVLYKKASVTNVEYGNEYISVCAVADEKTAKSVQALLTK